LAQGTRRKDGRLPTHWTDKDVRRRAQSVGLEAKYVEAYPLLSWYVHAGAAGTAGRAIEAIIGFCHGRIHEMFVDATKICANVMKIANSEYFEAG
jgi:2-hydroxychromene-2-carboxylate isomerase